jgi:hypothetical protein
MNWFSFACSELANNIDQPFDAVHDKDLHKFCFYQEPQDAQR